MTESEKIKRGSDLWFALLAKLPGLREAALRFMSGEERERLARLIALAQLNSGDEG